MRVQWDRSGPRALLSEACATHASAADQITAASGCLKIPPVLRLHRDSWMKRKRCYPNRTGSRGGASNTSAPPSRPCTHKPRRWARDPVLAGAASIAAHSASFSPSPDGCFWALRGTCYMVTNPPLIITLGNYFSENVVITIIIIINRNEERHRVPPRTQLCHSHQLLTKGTWCSSSSCGSPGLADLRGPAGQRHLLSFTLRCRFLTLPSLDVQPVTLWSGMSHRKLRIRYRHRQIQPRTHTHIFIIYTARKSGFFRFLYPQATQRFPPACLVTSQLLNPSFCCALKG